MNRSNPSIELGGGEMNRATSSVVSSAKSDGASEVRISRSATDCPISIGSCSRQLLLIDSALVVGRAAVDESLVGCTSSSGR